MPGEAEKAAEHLGVPFAEFFHTRLTVGWWEEDGGAVFLLVPLPAGHTPGAEQNGDPRGRCTFLVDGRCSIHAAKPAECRQYNHATSRHQSYLYRFGIVEAWREHQKYIADLLGHEPQAKPFSVWDL